MLAADIELRAVELVRRHLRAPERLRIVSLTKAGEKVGEYDVRVLRPGVVELVNDDGEVYEVQRHRCPCDDGKFRRRPHGCKHRAALMQLGYFDVQENRRHEPRNEDDEPCF